MGILTLILIFNINFAENEGITFDDAFYKSAAVEKYNLQNTKDSYNYLKGYYARQRLEDFYDLYYKYPIYLEYDQALQNDIALRTTEKKIAIGDEISKAGHMLELNTKYYNYKMLELATLNSKYNVDINSMKLKFEQKKLDIEKNKLSLGKSRQLDVEKSENLVELAKLNLKSADIEYKKNSSKLFYYLGDEIEIKPEELISTALKDVDEYLKNVDFRFEILNKQKQNEISKLEIDIYESKKEVFSPKQLDELDKKLRLYEKNEYDIELLRLQIRDEIIKGYNELVNKRNQVDNFKELYENQKIRLEHMKELLNLGKISEVDFMNFEIKFNEVKNGYDLKVMDYNNYYRKFQFAISVGPKM